NALAKVRYPQGCWEVVIVDDGSPMPLDAIVERFKTSLNITLVRQNNAGPGAARNFGVSKARGEYIALTDDDCEPKEDWLEQFANALKELPNYALGGRTENSLTDNPYATASQLLIDYLYAYYLPTQRDGRFFATNNVIMPKAGFEAIGGFDCSF